MNTFNPNKKSKSILDCFTYDLKTFFFDDYQEIDGEETPATIMIVYEKKLPWNELGIFDAVQFRIFFDKDSLTGSNPVNVKFISLTKKVDLELLKAMVERVLSIYGEDDHSNVDWNEADDKAFADKLYRRVWTIEKGDSFVSIEYNEKDGITLSILFFNNMLKETDKYLEVQY
ncbi:MAG: hypothetical protein WCX31_08685 [Salinivirgaceae bacterium]|jgi:hypothetical protein